MKRSHPFPLPAALRRPPQLRMNPRPLMIPRPGVRMFSSRRRRVSRQASPIPPSLTRACARIHRLNSRRIICFLALHTMAILQAYQADVLKESEGTGLTPEAVKDLRRATDLALRATKHTTRAVGHPMAGSVAAERHLWLNLRREPLHRYGARSDRKSVSARFKRALLTQNRHSHP